MENTINEKTIASLLTERHKLTKKLRSWFCSWNQGVLISDQVKAIDNVIKQLSGIKE